MKAPLNELGLNDAARGIRNGSFSSEELVLACLERIRQRENHVGAWIHLGDHLTGLGLGMPVHFLDVQHRTRGNTDFSQTFQPLFGRFGFKNLVQFFF